MTAAKKIIMLVTFESKPSCGDRCMSIFVNIHRTHRQYTEGREQIEVEGRTVGECLKALVDRYPGLSHTLFYKNGHLRNHFEIYLNAESAFPGELKKQVADGDEITIAALLAGG